MNEIDSTQIKKSLLNYFRFNRGYACADEVLNGGFLSDIMIDSDTWTMEIEIKISKHDLITGELKKTTGWNGTGKNKHEEWTIDRSNKFALCVPEYLIETAEKWIEETNPKYGLFVYMENEYFRNCNIWIKKSARLLHNKYDIKFKHIMLKRLSSIRALTIK